MAKFISFSLIVAVAVFFIVASTPAHADADPVVDHVRQTRVICDLLGLGDSGCSARCIVQGKRGGWCEKGVCNCRN
ncbi:sapecin [Diachasma alloeum]|uniref:sapecin n=1 Tax=Diachasma alloeum TaxID=454923 RepID=UPI0007383E9B|nr:sapecin [Diachasma alloeum]